MLSLAPPEACETIGNRSAIPNFPNWFDFVRQLYSNYMRLKSGRGKLSPSRAKPRFGVQDFRNNYALKRTADSM
jgi:hypothetical protein